MILSKAKEYKVSLYRLLNAIVLIRTGELSVRQRRVLSLLVLCGSLSYPLMAAAQSETASAIDFSGCTDEKGVPSEWALKVHKGKADVHLINESGEKVLHMKSVKSSFTLLRHTAINVLEYPYLAWSWKALSLPARGDVREKSKDDNALQLCVVFKDRNALCYIWDSNAPERTIVDIELPWPLSVDIKMIVVESGDSNLGKWVTHTRNVYEDYRNLFKKEPPAVEIMGLHINTQHTGESAEGAVKNIVFKKAASPQSFASLK